MIVNGCDIVTCGDMKCRNHDCGKRIYLAENELGCYVAIPGLDCPEKPEWWRKQNTAVKPPIVPKPYYVWITERIRELESAIDENAARSYNHVKVWAFEIAMLKDMEKALDEARKKE